MNPDVIHQGIPCWRDGLIGIEATVQQVIANLERTAFQIVMVVSADGLLVGTITDGDIRRGMLRGLGLNSPIDTIIHREALVVPPAIDRVTVRHIMQANRIRQLPIVDGDRRVVGLHLWEELDTPVERENLMLIMAGGLGTRLRPHTEECPKPMLPVAGKPMLEHIIERAVKSGFRRFVISVHYLGHMIEEYFATGERWGVRIDYLRETSPLGTAGAIGLLVEHPAEPFLVTNGDVLTDINYGELLDYHIRHQAAATMSVRMYEMQNPFGVVLIDGIDIVGFDEKPVIQSRINAGVYVLDPSTTDFLASGEHCDMPELFNRVRGRGSRTVVYPVHEPWLDVGRPSDLELARRANGEEPDPASTMQDNR